jgi:hypothetical protein
MRPRLVLLALITLAGCDSGGDLLDPSAGRPSIDPVHPVPGSPVTTVPAGARPVYLEARLRGTAR